VRNESGLVGNYLGDSNAARAYRYRVTWGRSQHPNKLYLTWLLEERIRGHVPNV